MLCDVGTCRMFFINGSWIMVAVTYSSDEILVRRRCWLGLSIGPVMGPKPQGTSSNPVFSIFRNNGSLLPMQDVFGCKTLRHVGPHPTPTKTAGSCGFTFLFLSRFDPFRSFRGSNTQPNLRPSFRFGTLEDKPRAWELDRPEGQKKRDRTRRDTAGHRETDEEGGDVGLEGQRCGAIGRYGHGGVGRDMNVMLGDPPTRDEFGRNAVHPRSLFG